MAESVRVVCRCRPLNPRELALNSKICVQMDQQCGQVILEGDGPPKQFTFDGVYYMDSTAEQIYNDIVYPLVENVIEGYNGTVFAYGQTGSGKTYSMQGDESVPTQKGIIPRTFEHIFEATATTDHTKFLVHVSYLEIYNEEVRDLLGKDRAQKLEIKEHSERGVYVAGLSMHVCHDYNACKELMKLGFQNRHVGETLMNKDSSRSHSIFTVYVEAMLDNGSIRMGKLHLVDLAGSERQAKTGATGDRFKEATKINLSLSALGNVISALVDGKSKHIPYRDSKLTRLLQDSLGGNTKTLMVACVSPSDNNYDETLSTLRYANRAKNIKNKPKINEDPKDALLREYQEEIQRLKAMIQPGTPTESGDSQTLKMEHERLKEEYQKALNELRNQYQNEQKSKAKLQEEYVLLKKQYEQAVEALENDNNLDKDELQKRLQLLEKQFVGGEQANNEVLKKERQQKMRDAEKKMQRLAAALNVHSDDPLLHVYNSTQEKLEAVTALFDKQKRKVKSLESEIEDLHGEFELDRLDYLETIRKQDQQIKLLQQILDKIHPIVKRDCNYHNLDRVKKDAAWNEDQGKWILPELFFTKTTLPSATPVIAVNADDSHGCRFDVNDEVPKLKQRLAKSEEENIANTYFKQFNANNLVNKYKADRHRLIDNRNGLSASNKSTLDGLFSGVVYTDDIYDNSLTQFRKPQRLQALASRSTYT